MRRGACYPTRTTGSIHGTIGGLPAYSTSENAPFISLGDFPVLWNVYRSAEDNYCVESPGGDVYEGESFVHALSVAFVESRHGLMEEGGTLPEPWTPPRVLRINHIIRNLGAAVACMEYGSPVDTFATLGSGSLEDDIQILQEEGIPLETLEKLVLNHAGMAVIKEKRRLKHKEQRGWIGQAADFITGKDHE